MDTYIYIYIYINYKETFK